jgi:hypothetical protein
MPSSHFYLLHDVQTNSETHSASVSMDTGCLFLQKLNTTANVVHNITKNAFVKNRISHSRTLLGYGYIGARTDTTQQTNICLDIHCRNVWLHFNRQPFCLLQRHSNPMRTAASIWPDCRFETNSLCWRQTVGGDNIPVVSVSV